MLTDARTMARILKYQAPRQRQAPKQILGILGVGCLSPLLWAMAVRAEMPAPEVPQPTAQTVNAPTPIHAPVKAPGTLQMAPQQDAQVYTDNWTLWKDFPMPPVLRGSDLPILAVPPSVTGQWPDLSLEAELPRSPLAVNCLNFGGPEYQALDCRRLGALGGPELGPDFLPAARSDLRIHNRVRSLTRIEGLAPDFAADPVQPAEVRVLF